MASTAPSTLARALAAQLVDGVLDPEFSRVGNFVFKGLPVVDPATLALTTTDTEEDRNVTMRRFTKQEIAMSGGAIRSEDVRVSLLLPPGDDGSRYTGNSVLLDGLSSASYTIIDVTLRPGVGMVVLQCRR